MRKFLRLSGRDVSDYMGNRTAVSVEVSQVSTKGTTIGIESAGTARKPTTGTDQHRCQL